MIKIYSSRSTYREDKGFIEFGCECLAANLGLLAGSLVGKEIDFHVRITRAVAFPATWKQAENK